MAYVVAKKTAEAWVAKNQTQRTCGRDRYMIMERASKLGYGVWDNTEQCFVYVGAIIDAKEG